MTRIKVSKWFLSLELISIPSGCVHDTFKYQPKVPIHLSPTDPTRASVDRVAYGEASSFAWTPCAEVNAAAIASLLEDVDSGEQVTELEWLDYRTGTYTSTPICRTETGWVWSIDLFWWPMATKVAVRGKVAVPNIPGDEVVSDFPVVSVDRGNLQQPSPSKCSVEIEGDKFETALIYSAAKCSEPKFKETYAFLRAIVPKNGGRETYQVYSVVVAPKWPRFYAATIVERGQPKDLTVEEIAKDVSCSSAFGTGSIGCAHTTHVVFNVERDDLIYFAKRGDWEFKLKGRAHSEVLSIPRLQIEALLKSVPTALVH